MNWRDFVESTSSVENTLREDPAGVHSTMDFDTRDRYRHVVEAFSKYSGHSETEVARAAVELARGGVKQGGAQSHVGFYLVGKGAVTLERNMLVRAPFCAKASAAHLSGPAGDLSRPDRAANSPACSSVGAGYRAQWPARLAGRTDRRAHSVDDQPAGNQPGELAGDHRSTSRDVAAHGFQQGRACRSSHVGGRSFIVLKLSRH